MQATGLVVNQRSWTTGVEVRANQASARIRLLPLLARHLVVDGISADSASVAILKETPPGERPPSTKSSPGFLIKLKNMNIENVEQFSFNDIVVDGGSAQASGTVGIRIRGEVEIEDIDADWQQADIRIGDAVLADSLSVGFRGGFDSFNPKQEKGLALLAKLNAKIDLDGAVGSLVPLLLFFPEVEWIEGIDGEGSVAAQLEIESGKLQPGSVIDVAASDLELDFLGFRASGSGRVDAAVGGDGDSRAGEMILTFDQFQLLRRGQDEVMARGSGLSLATRAPDLGLVRGLSGLEVVLDIPDSEVPDISALAARLPGGLGVTVSGGGARLKGHLEVIGAEEQARGDIQMVGEGLAGSFRNMDFDIDMEINSKLSGQSLDDFRVELEGTEFKLFNGVFDQESVKVDELWWMTVAIPEGYANLAEPLEMEARVDMSMKDTRAIIALFAEVKEWIRIFNGILTVEDVTGTAHVRVADKRLSVSGLGLTGDRLEALAELDIQDGERAGIFWGKLGIFGLGVERIGEETNWKMINGRDWYEEKRSENWTERTGSPAVTPQ